MKTLVTGGSGYIGAHVVNLLLDRGDSVVIADDLVTGVPSRVSGVPTRQMDLADPRSVPELRSLIAEFDIDSVVHFAARKQVLESVERPAWYYQQNVGSLANVLIAIEESEIDRVVFSSSAAVYGTTQGDAIVESDPTSPVNPYGDTKLVGERMITSAAEALAINAASLRYFNVAGAGRPELGDRAVLNLVPMVFERIDVGESPVIFGDDYNTADGTCVRDYIHVQDLAEAHLAVLDHLPEASLTHQAYNVGTGVGTSVREMIDMIGEVSGKAIKPRVADRRPGDPAAVVASPVKISDDVGWSARLSLHDIVESAWSAHLAFRAE